jgi:hypothetical protein
MATVAVAGSWAMIGSADIRRYQKSCAVIDLL